MGRKIGQGRNNTKANAKRAAAEKKDATKKLAREQKQNQTVPKCSRY